MTSESCQHSAVPLKGCKMGELNQELQAKVVDPARNLNNAINFKRPKSGSGFPTWVKEEIVKEFFRQMGTVKAKPGEGNRAVQIGRSLGHDPGTIYNWARQLKIRGPIMPARGLSRNERVKLRREASRLRRQGLSYEEIAEKLPVRVAANTVSTWLPKSLRSSKNRGLDTRRRGVASSQRVIHVQENNPESFPPKHSPMRLVSFTIEEIMECIPKNINQQILDRIELALRRKADTNGKA